MNIVAIYLDDFQLVVFISICSPFQTSFQNNQHFSKTRVGKKAAFFFCLLTGGGNKLGVCNRTGRKGNRSRNLFATKRKPFGVISSSSASLLVALACYRTNQGFVIRNQFSFDGSCFSSKHFGISCSAFGVRMSSANWHLFFGGEGWDIHYPNKKKIHTDKITARSFSPHPPLLHFCTPCMLTRYQWRFDTRDKYDGFATRFGFLVDKKCVCIC